MIWEYTIVGFLEGTFTGSLPEFLKGYLRKYYDRGVFMSLKEKGTDLKL